MFEKLNLVVLGRWFNVHNTYTITRLGFFFFGDGGRGFFLVKSWNHDSIPLFFMDCLHQCSTTAMANSQGCSLI